MATNYTQAWLEDATSIRGLLVEVTVKDLQGVYGTAGSENIIYLSNIGYISGDSQTSYLPFLTGSLQTTETLSIDGSLSMSFGDIQIVNANGERDDWLDSSKFIWVNRPIQIYIGDPRWQLQTISDIHDTSTGGFQKIFDGVISDIDSSSREILNIKVRDKLQRLNEPITDNKLGTYGTWGQGQTNQDSIRPLIFGEVFNVSPILVDPSKLEYMFHDINVGVIITKTDASGNLLTCISTKGFKVDAPAYFTGTLTNGSNAALSTAMFGGLTAGTKYYIKTIDSPTTFTISSTVGGSAVILITASSVTTSIMQVEVEVSSAELVIEIRDNGVPVYTDASVYTLTTVPRPNNAIIDYTTGKFRLTKPPAGTITASIQGAKRSINLNNGDLIEGTYVNDIAKIIALIATQYGTPANRLSAGDLDLDNLRAFSLANTQSVGIAITDRANTLQVCQDIAKSANARLFINRLGLLQLLQLGTPTSDPKVYITDNDLLHHSLQVSQKTEVIAATKVGYCKNYTLQTNLATSLPTIHNTMFREPWLSNTVTDATVQANFKVDVSPIQIDTLLIKGSESAVLANNLNNYFKVPRIIYSFTGANKLLSLKLGQAVNITHNRFGLTSGKDGQVVSLSPNWLKGTVNVGVII
jgi:flagellar basal body rod protein FlgF